MSMKENASAILAALGHGKADPGPRPLPPSTSDPKSKAAFEQSLSDWLWATSPTAWTKEDQLFIAQQTLGGLREDGFAV